MKSSNQREFCEQHIIVKQSMLKQSVNEQMNE